MHYPIPLNKQPAVADKLAVLPVGDEVARQILSIPMSAGLTHIEQAHVVQALAQTLINVVT